MQVVLEVHDALTASTGAGALHPEWRARDRVDAEGLRVRGAERAEVGEAGGLLRWVVDPLDVLDHGWDLLNTLREATEPAGLLAWIDRIALFEDRRDVVCAVFAAAVHQICGDHEGEVPAAFAELERRWYARLGQRQREE